MELTDQTDTDIEELEDEIEDEDEENNIEVCFFV